MRGSRSVCSRAWGGGVGGVRWGWIQTELPFGFGKTLFDLLETFELGNVRKGQARAFFEDFLSGMFHKRHEVLEGLFSCGATLLALRDFLAQPINR